MSNSTRVLKWARPLAVIFAWGGLVYLASHRSQSPTVLGRFSTGYGVLVGIWAFLCLALTLCLHPGFRAALASKKKPLIALAVGLLFAVGLSEVALRLTDPLGFSYLGEMQSYIRMRQPDETLVYTQPKSQTVELDGTSIRFNSLGLRGPEIGPKAPDERRVLFLGDSVVFGWGVEEERIFTSRIPKKLSEATETTWIGINSGVCSYNSEQEELYLKHRGLALEPDLVVLVLIDNDVLTYSEQWKQAAAAKNRSPIRRFQKLLKGSHLYKLGMHAIQNGLGGVSLEGGEQTVEPGSEGWVDNMNALGRIVELCHANDLPLVLFHYRWKPSSFSDTLLAAAREATAPIPIIDTADWFEDAPLRSWINSATDSHPNALAHERTANRMIEVFRSQKALPE